MVHPSFATTSPEGESDEAIVSEALALDDVVVSESVAGAAASEQRSSRIRLVARKSTVARVDPVSEGLPVQCCRRESATIAGGTQTQFLEISIKPDLNLYMAMPAGRRVRGNEQIDCTVEIDFRPQLDVRVQLQNSEADMLLKYVDAGMQNEAHILATDAWTAELLLRDKLTDPIAAAVGGYALLRFGEVDRLHDWTKNLAEWAKWLPDGLVIYAEHLAQAGKHAEAYSQLLRLSSRGLPLFSVGLSKALGRLRLYATATFDGDEEAQAAKLSRARRLIGTLQAYASVCVFTNPMTNFTAPTPRLKG